jgi:hypothetical protein
LVDADPQRQRLIRRAFRLEWLSVGWMAVEAAVAVASGFAARSVTLIAFGLDSVIELASAIVLIWRLSTELRFGREVSEAAEIIARRIAGGLLFALAAYVVAAAGWSLWRGEGEAFSWPGLAVALLSIPIMFVLAHRKLVLADQLGSRALRADAAESLACLWLSLVVVLGLVAQLAFGAWWIDAVTSLAIVWFSSRKGARPGRPKRTLLLIDETLTEPPAAQISAERERPLADNLLQKTATTARDTCEGYREVSFGGAGDRGSCERWPDLTQRRQPCGPAAARSVDPAGSLSQEHWVNSSPPSVKAPSRTSSSMPAGIGTAIVTPGAQRSTRTSSQALSYKTANSIPGRSGAGRNERAVVSVRTGVRSSGSNCHSLTKIVQPGSEPGV